MRITIAAVCLLLASVACASSHKTARSDGGTSVSITGTVQAVQPGDAPSITPTGVTGLAGSVTLKADTPVAGCDNPMKVYFTQVTTGSPGSTNALIGTHVDVSGTQYANCVFVAGSIAPAMSVGGGSSGGVSGSPGAVVPSPTASPKITKGPAPEGVIMKNTPSVPPASQK